LTYGLIKGCIQFNVTRCMQIGPDTQSDQVGLCN
jgi:hypothetical protein